MNDRTQTALVHPAPHENRAAGRTYRVVWNPRAGSKPVSPAGEIDRPMLLELLRRHDLGADVVETTTEEQGAAAVRDAIADGIDVVVGAGGDGTIGLVAAELLHGQAALGVLPLGSVMNVARMLGVPQDLEQAAATLATAPIRRVDVGVARGRPFLEAGSVGMNAAMFREAQRFDDGDWLSILRTVWVAIRYRPARMVLGIDGDTVRTRALMVAVANGPYTGAGMTIAPDAALDDGLFDVRVFRGFSKLELLRHLASIAFGRRRYAPHISTYRSARVSVTGARPLPCRADSRDLGTTPIEFRILSGALRVVAPPGGSDDSAGTTPRGASRA
jgi:diacylglycerol kinase (ATP)